jgi:homoserine kinase type II
MKYSKENLEEILKFWNLEFLGIREDLVIAGSPERTDFRVVIKSKEDTLYLLENFSQSLVKTKDKIIDVLEFLESKKLEKINNYIENKDGEYITEYDGKFWQLQKFIIGDDLDRINYIFDEWRGDVLADWLISFKEKSKDIDIKNKEIFSLKDYVYQIYTDVQNNDSQIIPRLRPIIEFLESNFMDNYNKLPNSFCHGDYHPLNVIWSQNSIKAVIDWEFCGYKSEIYDIANMISCVGMENPESLTRGLIIGFTKKIREEKVIQNISWKYLIDFMIAIRFAWLAEWLRKDIPEMIDLELTYMHLLKDNYQDLNNISFTHSPNNY